MLQAGRETTFPKRETTFHNNFAIKEYWENNCSSWITPPSSEKTWGNKSD
jgi:hypothetical protein